MHATTSTEIAESVPSRSSRQVTLPPPPRNIAVDAYRGLVMLLMMGEVLKFPAIARSYPDSLLWRIFAYNQTHVPWTGLGLHDTIQPSFTFLVGVALPYSIASRSRKSQASEGNSRTPSLEALC